MSEEKKNLNGFDGGIIEISSVGIGGGGSTDTFKPSGYNTDIVLPTSIKLKFFNRRTRNFFVRLQFCNGFIDIPLDMKRLEDWEEEIRRQFSEEEEEKEKED